MYTAGTPMMVVFMLLVW